MDGENAFVSHIRPPTRVPSPRKLSELSTSVNNARPTGMHPPPPGTLKRKTLVEQAGEVGRPAPAPPTSKLLGTSIKPTSVAGISRQKSLSSSNSSRPNSSASSYRNVSNGSFSSGTSYARGPSGQIYRPHSSMSAHTTQKSAAGPHRPASSIDSHTSNSRSLQFDGPADSMRPISSSLRKCSASSVLRKTSWESNDSQTKHTEIWPSSANDQCHRGPRVKSLRDISLITQGVTTMSINANTVFLLPHQEEENRPYSPQTPSQIPLRKRNSLTPLNIARASPLKSCKKTPRVGGFLSKDSNIKIPDWDLGNRVETIESMYAELKATVNSTTTESNNLKDNNNMLKSRARELEDENSQMKVMKSNLQRDLEAIKAEKLTISLSWEEAERKHGIERSALKQSLEDQKRTYNNDLDDVHRRYRRDLDDARRDAEEELRRQERVHRDEIAESRRKLEDVIEEEKDRRRKEVQELSKEGAIAQQKVGVELESKEKALKSLNDDLENSKQEIVREKDLNRELQGKLSESANSIITVESSMRSLRARIEFLESDCKSQSQAFADLEQRTQDAIKESEEAKAKLRAEETLRRKLHNQVQELKGNIRVFCRVRPTLDSEIVDKARIAFPDCQDDSKEVEVQGPEEKSSLGTITTKKNAFSFDRVFSPASQNAEVFDEISQLVQSALDGYNVCIFCYGQTGSGKTFTMSSEDGMIPRAVHQIYNTAQTLEEKGWKYHMEGSFVEVYNENINDLLGKAEEFDKKKHEIRHDMQKCKTTITDISTVNLDSPSRVEAILRKAMNNRSVAATKANERSSRSHSVFILKLLGENSITGEKSEGTLNLVDLAGSERLSHSGATGDRLKETQNINKSLSCLGDVIGALGQGKEGGHIPYRNSKLTYLLQFSLGGNSKTLMFVMISPLQGHLSETLTSLKFATKVHNTHIGTAKRQSKVRD